MTSTKPKILIVEDELIVAQGTRLTLTRFNYEVVGIAVSGEEAIAMACAHLPDLVLMDIHLEGEMDGIEAATQIQARHHTSFVYATAFSDHDTLSRAKLTRPSGFVRKPFDGDDLHVAIEVALHNHKMERQLKDSEERYRMLFEFNPHPMWVYDLKTLAFLAVNEAAVRHYGYRREEFLAMSIKDIRPSEDIPALLDNVARVSSGLDRAGIWRHLKRDGTCIEVEISSHTCNYGGREAELVLAHDVTERRRADKALREREAQYKSLFQNMLNGFAYCRILYDQEGGRDFIYLEVNPAFERLTGLKNVTGRKASEVIPGIREADPELLEIYARVASTGRAEQFENYVESLGIWFSLSVYCPAKDHFVAIFDNITERKKNEADIQLLSDRLQLATRAANVGIWDLDLVADRLVWDDAMHRLYSVTPQQFAGRYEAWLARVHPEDRDRAVNEFKLAIADQKTFGTEFRVIWPDKSVHYLKANGLVQRDKSGQPIRMLGTNWDITERKAAEEALRHSEEQYRTLAESALDAIFIFNRQFCLDYINQAGARPFGRPPAELIGQSIMDLFSAETATSHKKHLERALQCGHALRIEEKILFPQNALWLNLQLIPLRNPQGELTGVLVIGRDMTERREAHKKLAESQAQLARAQQFSHIMVAHVGLDGRWLRVPPNLCRLLGYSESELLALTVWDVTVPKDAEADARQLRSMLNSDIKSFTSDKRIQRNDGQLVWVNVNYTLVSDDQGVPLQFLAYLRDITERKLAEQHIREQASLLDNAHEAIMVFDLHGHIRYWNRGAERLYGWTSTEVIGKSAEEFFALENAAKFNPIKERVIQLGEWRGEFNNVSKRALPLVVMSQWTLVRDEDRQPKAILIIDTDVTEQKKLEAQFLRAQRMESLGTLTSGIAHDLNNILAPILMTTSLLADPVSEEDKKELLATLESNVRRGTDIVKQLLVFGRGISLEKNTLNPGYLVKEMAKLASETFPRNLCIHTEIASDLWFILANPTQVQQVLMNLCVNARDAMPHGGDLTMSAINLFLDEPAARSYPDAHSGPHVVIKVRDTGTGIAPEIVDRIFDPFFTTKEMGKGTGLGLSTVLGIAKSHGGFVTVSTQIGKGSEFRVHFPAALESIIPETTAPLDLVCRGQGEQILVVDDETSVSETLIQLLERQGYRTMVANQGRTAVQLFIRHRTQISAVVTDLAMPEMNGVALVRALKELDPQVKILVCTGLDQEPEEKELKRLGVEQVLKKPFSTEILLTQLRQLLTGA